MQRFVQDDFKVTSKLTLNLGFRYDFGRPREEARGRLRGFDPAVPNPAAGGRLGAIVGAIGQGGLQAENFGLVEPDRTNFGPRFGFAYRLTKRPWCAADTGSTTRRSSTTILETPARSATALVQSISMAGSTQASRSKTIRISQQPIRIPKSSAISIVPISTTFKDFKTGRTVIHARSSAPASLELRYSLGTSVAKGRGCVRTLTKLTSCRSGRQAGLLYW